MTVYFGNPGVLDMDTVRLMGVSIKSEGAIGYFGTGLKYAIATLLRTGHVVQIFLNNSLGYEFKTQEKEIRGKKFNVIMMNDEQLGFTTDLGKDWKVWQAYRELHSNCLDENGKISDKPMMADTIIVVKGQEITDCYHERHNIFLHGDPAYVMEGLEVHRGSSDYVFYRGVRVHKLPKKALFTYNIISPMSLTEDRTASSAYDIQYRIECRIPTIPDASFAKKLLMTQGDFFDQDLDFGMCGEPSEEFLKVVEENYENQRISQKAKNLLKKSKGDPELKTFELTPTERVQVEQACDFLKRRLNISVKLTDLTFVEQLGASVVGAVTDGKMCLARQALANGVDFTAITIYEEWLHLHMGFADKSLGLQQFLFDKVLQLAKEIDNA